ncbi:NAD(P)H-dependent oxidoreductase [Mycobacterium simiae]|uniref:NAD(P)H-dependent oxidoreductase n=1 Tax=Mycobacterium simiae TaxID=1784 RepID=UPI00262F25D5|nr:NAD(P)H-dependent oxidoreductase [Mycobacterium simiae]
MTENSIRVLGISGSLRRASHNTATLVAAQALAPARMTIDIESLAGVPMFNEDTESAGSPPAVIRLAQRVAAADALLLATPEYNHSYSAPIKNALDWLSRTPTGAPPGQHVLSGKPVALLGASTGRSGSGRAQLHLRQVLSYLNMLPINQPEVLIDSAKNKFADDGSLHDAPTRKYITMLLDRLAAWVDKLAQQDHVVDLSSVAVPTAHIARAGTGPSYTMAGDSYIIKAAAHNTGGAYAAFEFFVPPGGGPPPHLHEREYEGFYILEGELAFYVGADRTRVNATAGDFVAAPLGVIHQFKNETSFAARAFVIAAPAGVEDYFAAAGTPMPDGSTQSVSPTAEDLARLIDLAPRWGMQIFATPADIDEQQTSAPAAASGTAPR